MRRPWLWCAVLLVAVTGAQADVCWPALYIMGYLWSPWPILCGLLIEYFAIRQITAAPRWRAIAITISINAFSALVGFVLIPIVSFMWELLGIAVLVHGLLQLQSRLWEIPSILIVAAITIGLECFALRRFYQVRITPARLAWLAGTNLLSTLIASAQFMVRGM